MKVIQAIPGMPKPVTEGEIDSFLQKKLNMQLATIDKDGYPIVQPVWFIYDKNSGKLFTGTQKSSRKVRNIRENPNKVYFSIDDEDFPYKGVKGRASAKILEDIQENLAIMEKINMKYLGTLEHPIAKMIMDNARNGIEVGIQLTPRFFSAWDFAKAQ
jgi:nitroimidazol reductase NimA-like FMN-containing flavoprotein (pyridoxamine 5'-phosphate oxidase superfamily)